MYHSAVQRVEKWHLQWHEETESVGFAVHGLSSLFSAQRTEQRKTQKTGKQMTSNELSEKTHVEYKCAPAWTIELSVFKKHNW